jgi:uncharacterized membrane protein
MTAAFPHRVEHLSIGEPDPFPAEAPAPRATTDLRSDAADPAKPDPAFERAQDSGRIMDPLMTSLDHFVALAGYVLLFLSVFMFGVPALASVALAYAHRRDAHLVVRTHFGFQIRIFWTAVLLLVLSIASAVAGGGAAFARLFAFAREHLPGAASAVSPVQVGAWSGVAAACLIVAAVVLFVLAALWLLAASFTGFLRLLAGRAIGHLPQS